MDLPNNMLWADSVICYVLAVLYIMGWQGYRLAGL